MKLTIRRSLVLLITFTMTFTTGMASVFAEGGDAQASGEKTAAATRLLVLGDSTSSGYELDDYINVNVSFSQNNRDLEGEWTYDKAVAYNEANPSQRKGRISDSSYPWQLRKYIAEKTGSCELSSLCLNGMRTDELRAFLDPAYCEKISAMEEERTASDGRIGFLTDHMTSFTDSFHDDGVKVNGRTVRTYEDGGVADAQAYVQKEITDADVIVVDCCMNNFGTYLAERIGGRFGLPNNEYAARYGNITIDDIDDVPPEVKDMLRKVKARLKEEGLTSNLPEEVDFFVDTFLYCYADAITNFSADLAGIRKLNPDARIVVVGLYNTFDGVRLAAGEKTVDFGRISSYATGLFNVYLKNLDKNRPEYYYADISGELETFVMQLKAADTYEDLIKSGNENLLNKMYDSFCNDYLPNENELIEQTAMDAAGGYWEMMPADQKAELRTQIRDELKARVLQMMIDAADCDTIDLVKLLPALAGIDDIVNEIAAYLTSESGKAKLSDSTLMLLHIYDRFLLNNGMGQHPSLNGCKYKYQQVQKAYDRFNPEYEAFKGVVKDMMALAKLLRNKRSPENCAAIAAKIQDIRTGLNNIRKGGKPFNKARLSRLTNEMNEYIDKAVVMLQDQTKALLQRIRKAKTQQEIDQAQNDLNTLDQAVNELPADSADKKELRAELSDAQTKLDAKAEDVEMAEENGGQGAGDAGGTPAAQEPAGSEKAPEQAAPAPATDTVDASMPAVKKLRTKASKRAFTVKWKKLSKSQRKLTDAIEVQYSKDPNFASADTVTKTVSDKKASKKISGLDKKTKYYVRVRTVSGADGAGTVSKWSGRKTVKVR